MLSSIKGRILDNKEDKLVVDVNGFGIEVNASLEEQRKELGEEVFLYTHLSITQNGVSLYGFTNKKGRDLFKTVIKVPNVGPKTAFSLLRGLGVKGIKKALENNNPQPIAGVKGIGKKTSKRIILELKDKINFTAGETYKEAKQALIQLGFLSGEADQYINKIIKNSKELTSDEIVEKVLKES